MLDASGVRIDDFKAGLDIAMDPFDRSGEEGRAPYLSGNSSAPSNQKANPL